MTTSHNVAIDTSLRDPEVVPPLRDRVYYVGQRYKHHARHSGYEGYGRYIGTHLKSPVDFRWISAQWGWALNTVIAVLTRHPMYSAGALLTEGALLMHMLRRRGCVYHFLYGDSDLWLLGLLSSICRLTGNRVVASFHEPASKLKSIKTLKQVSQNIDAVILVSNVQRAYFEEFLQPEQIFVVPHGIDTDFFCPLPDANHQPVCITVGSHLRDFQTLKQSMQLVWAINPQVRFIAVGTRNDEKNCLSGLEDDRIQYLEKISDERLREAYQTSQMAIFPFQQATANNAILEAIACGLPIVATDIGGTREYVDETIGVLCSPYDPEEFANGILQLIKDSAHREALATASRERSLNYHYRFTAAQMYAIYSRLIRVN